MHFDVVYLYWAVVVILPVSADMDLYVFFGSCDMLMYLISSAQANRAILRPDARIN